MLILAFSFHSLSLCLSLSRCFLVRFMDGDGNGRRWSRFVCTEQGMIVGPLDRCHQHRFIDLLMYQPFKFSLGDLNTLFRTPSINLSRSKALNSIHLYSISSMPMRGFDMTHLHRRNRQRLDHTTLAAAIHKHRKPLDVL